MSELKRKELTETKRQLDPRNLCRWDGIRPFNEVHQAVSQIECATFQINQILGLTHVIARYPLERKENA